MSAWMFLQEGRMTRTDHFAKSSWMLTLVSLSVVVAVLHFAKGLLVPLMLAVLLSFLLVPICEWLERRRVGRIPAVLITVILAFSLLGTGTWTAANQVIDLAPKIPEYQGNIKTKLLSINQYLDTALGKFRRSTAELEQNISDSGPAFEQDTPEERPAPVRVISPPQSPVQVIGQMFGSMLMVTASSGLVVILVIFILFRREDLRDRFIRLVGQGQLTLTTQTLEDAASRVSRFLLMQLLVNIAFGVPIGIGLFYGAAGPVARNGRKNHTGLKTLWKEHFPCQSPTEARSGFWFDHRRVYLSGSFIAEAIDRACPALRSKSTPSG